MVLTRIPAIMIRRIMTGTVTVVTKLAQLMSGKIRKTTSQTRCRKSRARRRMIDVQQDKSYHVGVTMTADEGEAFFGKCYNCGEPGHPWRDCKKLLKPSLRLALNSEIERKAQLMEKKWLKQLNWEGGHQSEGRPCPQGPSGSSSELRAPCNTPCSYWNEDARDRWLGLENISQTLIDGEQVTALIDNGTWVNTVIPSFVKRHGLKVGSIDDLNKHWGRIPVSCSGGYYTEPIGYVLIWVQFPRIPSYDENQVALVIRDGSEFSQRVLVIIGTPTIDQVVRALKESELDTIPEEWQRARHAHEYVNGFFVRSMNPAGPLPTNTNQNPLDLNEKVFLKNKCTIPRSESVVVRARTHCTMMMGYRLNVMTQVPYVEDWANLLVGVYVIPMYSELRDGSQSLAIMLHNLTGKPVYLHAGRVIARVLTANVILEGKPTPELMKKLDEQDPESTPPNLSIEERQQLLMQLLRQEGGLDELAQ